MHDSVHMRHYPKVRELVCRSTGDLSQWALDKQFFGKAMLEKLIQVGPQRPNLVSSVHGRITHLLWTIPSYAVIAVDGVANPIATVYRDMIAKLPEAIRITVLTHSSVEATVGDWFKSDARGGVELIAAPDHLRFSVWAEDGYVISTDAVSGDTFFVEPYEFHRYGDSLIADLVSNETDLRHTQAPLYFQGGNVLIGDDFFLIGADYPAKTAKYIKDVILPEPGEKPFDTVHRLYREYMDAERELHYIGSTIPVPAEVTRPIIIDGEQWTESLYRGNKAGTVQPLFHIDMFITLAGRDSNGDYQVVVGDPGLAAKVLGVPLWPHAMQQAFDNVAKGLRTLGFSVIRNPLPMTYVDDTELRERKWYFATANNALVQITDTGEKSVWLPAYGFGHHAALAKTDRANVLVWEALGFSATLLADFHVFAENLGAVHCIKKYLGRS